jgi:hypothetical protein
MSCAEKAQELRWNIFQRCAVSILIPAAELCIGSCLFYFIIFTVVTVPGQMLNHGLQYCDDTGV